ncbi:MAG: UPF0182 family membrane protein [Propionibacteriaceae bacterium]
MSSPLPARPRGAILPTLVVVGVLLVLFAGFTSVWTDRLWFRSFGYGQVFSTMLWTRVGLFAVFGLLMAVLVVANVAIAYRLRPKRDRPGPQSPLLVRYREVIESHLVLVLAGVGVIVGLFAGGTATAQATTYLAWRNGVPFGETDPKFGLDISFFVFDYPWVRFLLSFVFTALIFSAIAAAVVHYVVGALRLERGGGRRSSPSAQAHLSILVGVAVLLRGVGYWFDQYGLEITDSKLFTGIGYTADNATVTAKLIMAIIAGLCALMFFANAILRRWLVPLIGLVLMVLSGLILGVIYPAAVQQFSVNPDEPDKERPYIERNIEATRAAYGVEDTGVDDYSATTTASAGQLRSDAEALPGIRLMDPAVVGPAYEQLQQVRGYYSFPDVLDVDRYTIDGEETDAVVAAREMDVDGLDQQNWNNRHTVFTHGYGLVAAYGNKRQSGGEPEWIAKDIPPTGELSEHEPRIYYGEIQTDFSIVGRPAGADPIELDTPGGGEGGNPTLYAYTGEGGVPIGGFFNQLLYAAKFADVNILLSDRVTEASKIIYDRGPRDRVQAAAPWLTVDTNAYPAIVEGRMVWIVDGYTTSDAYPYSQRVSLEQATSDSQTSQGTIGAQPDTMINYMRNSVKAVVDAYDGSVELYAWDEEDPVLKTWRNAFPDLVHDRADISDDLLTHLRYPEDLFKVQREILAKYHVTDPGTWFQQSDQWEIPADPVVGTGVKETPYYLSIKWPGDEDAVFSQTTVFVPRGRSNLSAYMAVNADASSPDYGQMRILRMSDTTQIDGPGQAFNAMTTNETVAERLRPFLNQGSSKAIYGNLLTLPVGGGLLYVQPIYTQLDRGEGGSYPALRFVVVRFGTEVGIGDTLQQALDQVFAGNAGADTGEEDPDTEQPEEPADPGTGDPDNPAATAALEKAEEAFTSADKALKAGDLATYQTKMGEAQTAVQEAMEALGG